MTAEKLKMPMIDADGCLLNVSVEGRDGGPTLMLSNSLGSTMQMWEPQMKALTQVFRVIRYDRRGHGKSNVPPGPYSLERFGRDVLAILDALHEELGDPAYERTDFDASTEQKKILRSLAPADVTLADAGVPAEDAALSEAMARIRNLALAAEMLPDGSGWQSPIAAFAADGVAVYAVPGQGGDSSLIAAVGEHYLIEAELGRGGRPLGTVTGDPSRTARSDPGCGRASRSSVRAKIGRAHV